jgi:voltage-gated potassium channel
MTKKQKKKTAKKKNQPSLRQRLWDASPVRAVRGRFTDVYMAFRRSQVAQIAFIATLIICVSTVGIYYIERNDNPDAFATLFDSFWYIIVTMTTVGYGDKFPLGVTGKIFGIFIMMIGVAVMGTVTGRIASFLVERQMRAGKGLIGLSNMENHFIICGWKKDLANLLHDILDVNYYLKADSIVLINKADSQIMDELRNDPRFTKIKFIYGDHTDENVLVRANIKKANTILLLADQIGNPTPMETDSRTVMASMTVEALNKKIYTCAELLDSKFEKHLKLSDVDEIILSRDHGRVLLANASSATGIGHVIDSLIGVHSPNPISVFSFPPRFVGSTFGELSAFMRNEYNDILVGILENTGNMYMRKQEALKEAQKTPDISKLVENLKIVKHLQANDPIINPSPDYIINKNSKAIVIKSGAKKDAKDTAASAKS